MSRLFLRETQRWERPLSSTELRRASSSPTSAPPWVRDFFTYNQCCGSVTFWYGSGTTDPCLWLIDLDPDPDPAPFTDLQDANKKQFLMFLEGTFTSFLKIKKKVIQKSQKSRNQSFSYYFCLLTEGSGSGSRRPKNIQILRTRIQICNTAYNINIRNMPTISLRIQ